MMFDEHGKVMVDTHDKVSVNQPTTMMQQETHKITQEENEETNESAKEIFNNSLQKTYQLWMTISKIMSNNNKIPMKRQSQGGVGNTTLGFFAVKSTICDCVIFVYFC